MAAILKGVHISLVICVRGYTYHGGTHISATPLVAWASPKAPAPSGSQWLAASLFLRHAHSHARTRTCFPFFPTDFRRKESMGSMFETVDILSLENI